MWDTDSCEIWGVKWRLVASHLKEWNRKSPEKPNSITWVWHWTIIVTNKPTNFNFWLQRRPVLQKPRCFKVFLYFIKFIESNYLTDNCRLFLYKVQNEEDGWYIVNQNRIHHHSDYGYQSYYYYCGDVTMFLNTTWVPVLTWLTVNIFPILLLVILSNARKTMMLKLVVPSLVACYLNRLQPLENIFADS